MSSTNQRAGYGVKSLVDLADMEKAQPLSDHPLAIDAVSLVKIYDVGPPKEDILFDHHLWFIFQSSFFEYYNLQIMLGLCVAAIHVLLLDW